MTASALNSDLNLDAYFRRIGVSRSAVSVPDLATLSRIVAGHTQSITFENLDAFTGREVRLDLASLTAKMVDSRRGGWCFEHNLLLDAVLMATGYSTTWLTGRVLWNLPAGEPMSGRNHMLLLVHLPEGPYIVDGGFGVVTLRGALALEPVIEQQVTSHDRFRLTLDGSAYVVEAHADPAWLPLYRFDRSEVCFADLAMSSWYLSHHPESIFVKGLLLARTEPGCRYTLQGSRSGGVEMSVCHLAAGTQRRMLESPAEVRRVLDQRFDLDLSGLTGLEAALSRLF
jgi:N-hydroxyarylamine O-acetyltransferase